MLQICLAAAVTLAEVRVLLLRATSGWLPRRIGSMLGTWLTAAALLIFILLSLSRSIALVVNYGAPIKIYGSLPEVNHVPQPALSYPWML